MVSQTLLNELKTIIKKDYGLELSKDKLLEMGNVFVNYFSLLKEIEMENEHENENFGDSNR